MKHRFEGLEGYLAEVLDSVQRALFVDQKYIENYFSSYHSRTI